LLEQNIIHEVEKGNKSDLGAAVDKDGVEDFASEKGLPYFECSAKTGKYMRLSIARYIQFKHFVTFSVFKA
jgi:hypothetical protein